MPIYEYKCDECNESLEKIQKFSDDPLTKCPACGAEKALVKQMGRTSFRIGGLGIHRPTSHWGDMDPNR